MTLSMPGPHRDVLIGGQVVTGGPQTDTRSLGIGPGSYTNLLDAATVSGDHRRGVAVKGRLTHTGRRPTVLGPFVSLLTGACKS
jgi:hypothetical protein